MFSNYFKIALRNLQRHKTYSFLNIAGLAIGLAAATLILVFVQFELSYDGYHSKADRIYRVYHQDPGRYFLGSDYFSVNPAPLGKAMVADIPEVEASVSISKGGDAPVRIGNRAFMLESMLWAEPEIFTVFDFTFVHGDASSALLEPNTVVLSEQVAKRLFGDEDPLGQIMTIRDEYEARVTGVFKELPEESHFQPLLIVPLSTYEAKESNAQNMNWSNSSYYTYVLLKESARPEAVMAKLPAFTEKYMGELFKRWGRSEPRKYFLQPLTDIHLHSSHLNFDIGKNGNINTLYVLSALALVILFTACINYMNLATARASLRAKEVGVRKVVGAERSQIMRQFLGESLIFTGLAALIAAIMIEFTLPIFASLVDRNFDTSLLANLGFLAMFLFVSVTTGVLAGSYPAFVLARFQPVSVLKGQAQKMHRSKMRNVLVVFQFAASITLVISLFAILRQMEFIRTKDVGFQRDQIVTFKINGTDDDTRMPIFKERLLQHQNVLGASLSTSLPHNVNSSTGLTGIDDNGNQLTVRSYQAYADEQFLDLYGIPIISGEGLRRDDMKSYVVNEAFVKHFGWKDPIGKTLLRGDMQVQVVGVLRDFNAHSLYQPMEPLFLSWADFKWTSNLSVKIRPVDIPGTLNFFQRTWQELYPERPFQYAFLDDEFNLVYIDEERFSEVITYSAVLAITVALLGLFGLAAFIIEQRKKEIGVRKILGASLGAIVLTLSKEFMLLVGIANVLAWPIGYYFMSKWLENFAFRVDLGVGIFLLAAAGALVTAFLTVSIQSMRAASSNPIEALRYE